MSGEIFLHRYAILLLVGVQTFLFYEYTLNCVQNEEEKSQQHPAARSIGTNHNTVYTAVRADNTTTRIENKALEESTEVVQDTGFVPQTTFHSRDTPFQKDLFYASEHIPSGKFLSKPENRSRHCIMTVGAGYNASQIGPFIKSLRDTGYDGDIIIGIKENATRDVMEKYAENNVILYEIYLHEDAFAQLANHRYAYYREWIWDYLEPQHAVNDRFIIFTDSRDVFFQSNPFESIEEQFPSDVNIHLFAEDARRPIGIDSYNYARIKDAFGAELAKFLEHKLFICAGVIIGRAKSMYELTATMIHQFNSNNFKQLDQSHLNVLYYSGALEPFGIKTVPFGEGLVATLLKGIPVEIDDGSYVVVSEQTERDLQNDVSIIGESQVCEQERLEGGNIARLEDCWELCGTFSGCDHFAFFPETMWCNVYTSCNETKKSFAFGVLYRVLRPYYKLNSGKYRPSIIHQYDRHDDVNQMVHEKWHFD